jgi:ferric-dicitrate binding protein FerR (iron transport regulator)
MNNYIKKVIEQYTQSGTKHPAPEAFRQWLTEEPQSAEKDEALRRLWSQPENMPAEEIANAWESLKLRTQFNGRKPSVRLTVWKYAAAIALLVALVGVSLFSTRAPQEPLFTEYFTGYGKSETVTLPDGSVVQTNSGTLMVYPETFGPQTRTLYLSGEANFKVVANPKSPFIVKTKHLEVMALGTEFSVSSYAEDRDASATLLSGSIRVTAGEAQSVVVLQPGEQLAYHKQQHDYSVHRVDIDEATAWQRGDLIFRGATIPDILSVLERKYNVAFQYRASQMSADKFNFYFKKETAFADIMDIITIVAGKFDYRITYNPKD